MTLLLAKRRRALFGLVAACAACSVYERNTPSDSLETAGSAGLDGGGSGAKAGTGGAPQVGASGATTEAGVSNDGGAGEASSQAGSSAKAGTGSTAAGAPGNVAAAGEAAGGATTQPERVLELLDDMEDGDAFVAPLKGRNGHWDVSNDATAGATQTPLAASFTMKELADATRPDSLFAAYTQGAGFKDWGAFMTVSMRTWPDYDQTPAYDASAYVGVSFYAKVGAGSDTTLRVRYIGGQTDPRGQQCTPGGSIETACYDHFFAQVKLSQSWQRVDLLFADFQQAGVGKSFPAIDLTRMYALEFFFPGRKTAAGNAFELWVDDLAFMLQ